MSAVLLLAAVVISGAELIHATPGVVTGAAAPSLAELEKKISQLEKGIAAIKSRVDDARSAEIQREFVSQRLSAYPTREEARKSYDQLQKQIDNLKHDVLTSERETKDLVQRLKPNTASPSATGP